MRASLQWYLHRITGVILFFGLVTHMYIMHYCLPDAFSYEAVAERLSDPRWIAFNFLFLISIVYHGMTGLWGVLVEYLMDEAALKVLKMAFYALSLGLILTGVYILTV